MPFHVQRDVGGGCRVVGQQTLAAMKTGERGTSIDPAGDCCDD
jgi:hypothetical protein